jgi:hypothetical protein
MQELKRDHCFICAQKTEHGYVFCEDCSPRYGQTTRIFDEKLQKQLSLYVGRISTTGVIKDRLQGRLPIKWWMGTDALTMWFKPPGRRFALVMLHRIKMLLLEPFIYRHWLTGPRLIDSLRRSKFIDLDKARIVFWPGKMHRGVEKSEHDGFNILYYHPSNSGEFERWVYGIDIIEQLQARCTDVTWIRIDGSQDMREIFPVVDLYLRPSRHDGQPRINLECEINDIPVLFSHDGNPTVPHLEEAINQYKGRKLQETNSNSEAPGHR